MEESMKALEDDTEAEPKTKKRKAEEQVDKLVDTWTIHVVLHQPSKYIDLLVVIY